MKNTNDKEIRYAVFDELLLDVEDADGNTLTGYEAARRIQAMYDHAANYEGNVRRYPNDQERVTDWLQGLPLSIPFYNYDIIRWTEEMHGHSLSDRQEQKVLDNYWNLMAFKLIQLWRLSENDAYFKQEQKS